MCRYTITGVEQSNWYLWREYIFVEFVVSQIVVLDVTQDAGRLLKAEQVDAEGRPL